MIVEWYPGHMKKAREQISEKLPQTDLFIEILDARLPVSSANPLLEKLRGAKPCIKVLNKNDLADPEVTAAWVAHLERQAGVRALPLDARQRRDTGMLPKLCRKLVPARTNKPGKALRVMVAGIPNVGKSTLINTLAGKKMARVGDKAGITTCPQQVDLRNGILLNDTPGLLWPVMDNPAGALRLAASGALGDDAYDSVEVAIATLAYLLRRYPDFVTQRYKLAELKEEASDVLDEIGRRRGCLVKGGEIDRYRAAELLLRELRSGTLGHISLERPEETAELKEEKNEE